MNPQGACHRLPTGARPIGRPFRCFFNASTRTRTRNTSLEARHDLHFTIEAKRQRKARDLNPHLPRSRTALAERPGQPYPATFRIQRVVSGPTGNRTRIPACRASVMPLDHEPIRRCQWTAGELNPDLLVATQMSCRWTSSPSHREITTDFGLHPRRSASVAPGVEPSPPKHVDLGLVVRP